MERQHCDDHKVLRSITWDVLLLLSEEKSPAQGLTLMWRLEEVRPG